MLTHPTGLFSRYYIFRPLGGAAYSNFYTTYNTRNNIVGRTWGTGRPQVGLCPIFLVFHELELEVERKLYKELKLWKVQIVLAC